MSNGTPSLPLSAAAGRIPSIRAPSQVGQFGAFLQAMLGTRSARREEALRQALADLERRRVEAEEQAAADRRSQLDLQRQERQESRAERKQREDVEAFRRQMERSRERISDLRAQAEEREAREALSRYAPGVASDAPSGTQEFLIGQETARQRIAADEAAAVRAEGASERATASARRQELQALVNAAQSTREATDSELRGARAERLRIVAEIPLTTEVEIPDGRGGTRPTTLMGLQTTNFLRYNEEVEKIVESRSPGLGANIKRLEAELSAARSRVGDAEEAMLREFGVMRDVERQPQEAPPRRSPEEFAQTQRDISEIIRRASRGDAANSAFMEANAQRFLSEGFSLEGWSALTGKPGGTGMLAGFDRPTEPAVVLPQAAAPPSDAGAAAAVEMFRTGAGAEPTPEAVAPPTPPGAEAPEVQTLPGAPLPVSGTGPTPSASQAAPALGGGPSSMSATALNAVLVQLSQTTDPVKALRLAQQAISGGYKRDQVLNRAHPNVRTFLAQRLQNRL